MREALDGLGDDLGDRATLGPGSKTLAQMARVPAGGRDPRHFSHHRLAWDRPAPTIDRGGGAGAYHVWHPGEHRPITTAELKRLAAFPDPFAFLGTPNERFARVGNAVPPLFMRAIAAQIRRALGNGPEPQRRFDGMTYLDLLDAAWAAHMAPRSGDAPTVVSTFAGCGGSSLGYSMAGYRELLAVEWDDNAAATFALNFPAVPLHHGDIAALSVGDALARIGLEPGVLDVLDGSPPCQGFSTAGARRIEDDRNQLFREYVRLLRGLRPRAFVMENVSGMVKGKMKLVFAEILRELKASGYRVSARLLNAMYFGVPQSRERMIFIGVREDLAASPSHPPASSSPISAGAALEDVLNDPAERAMLLAASLRYPSYRHWEAIPYGRTRASALGTPSSGFTAAKYDPDRPARTIAKTDGAISLSGAMHWAERRRFTVAEFKRFASFPDPFVFMGDWSQGVQRIGNSVPPLLMRAVAAHLGAAILADAETPPSRAA